MAGGSSIRTTVVQALILGFVIAAGIVTLLSSSNVGDVTQTTVCTFPHKYVRTGSLVRLDGRCADFTEAAAEDARLHYYWRIKSKPVDSKDYTIHNQDSLLASFVADVDGDYEIELSVGTTAAAHDVSTTLHVTASTGNARPMAEAGPYQEVAIGDTVQLHGSGTDADNQSLSYNWQFQPDSLTATLSSNTSPTPTFVAAERGEYTLSLKVNDGVVDSEANAVLIRAENSNLSLPVPVAGPDRVVTTGSRVSLDGSQSYSAYDRPLSYHWRILFKPYDSTATLSDTTGAQPSLTVDAPGPYLVRLEVNDGINDSTRSLDDVYEDRLVVVATANQLPVADGGADQSVNTGTLVSLNGSGSSDPENATLSYAWTLIKQPANSSTVLSATDTPTTSLTPDRDGDYLVRLVVNDGTNDSDPDIVRVSASSLSGGATPLTLLTSLPYAPPSSELPTNLQVDTDGSDKMRVVSPADETPGNFATAIQATYTDATHASFSTGPGWVIINPASLTIDESSTPAFIMQRSSDGMYYKFVLDFTAQDAFFYVQIDNLQGWRCGSQASDCP